MSHSSKIKDADAFFEVDAITRQIINKTPQKITLIQYDHKSESFTFSLPRHIEGHDMAESAKAEVHFINIETGGANSHADKYEMKDLQPDPNDESKVICTWLISNNATQYAGRLAFMVRFACVDDKDNYVYVWNTATNEEISITNGMDNGAAIVEKYPDILAQWRKDVLEGTASFTKLADGTNIDAVKSEGCYVLYNDRGSFAECITLHVVKAHVSDNEAQMDIPCIKQIMYIHSGQDSNEFKIQYRHDAFGKWSEWEDAFGGGSGGETFFESSTPQIDITLEEEVKDLAISELNGKALADYKFTTMKIVMENAQLAATGTNSEIVIRVDGNVLSGCSLHIPTTFINNSAKQYWGGYISLPENLYLSGQSASSNEFWRTSIHIPVNTSAAMNCKQIETINIKSVSTVIPIGTKIKIWLK